MDYETRFDYAQRDIVSQTERISSPSDWAPAFAVTQGVEVCYQKE